MRSKTQEKVLRVLLKALKPLVHLLLEVGIGHREFSEIAKRAFVDVATQKYGIRGRKTNISRVAVMTGLTRKEVKRIRDTEGEDAFSADRIKLVPAGLVLQHWHTDNEYTDSDNRPLRLPFIGNEPSFTSLVKKYAGDIPPGAVRTELLKAGAVESQSDGSLLALRREFRFVDSEDQLFFSLDRWIAGVNANITHNYLVKSKKLGDSPTWPNRMSEALKVRREDVPAMREYVRECATRFTEEIDDRITPFECGPETVDGDLVDVFAGLTYHEEPSS